MARLFCSFSQIFILAISIALFAVGLSCAIIGSEMTQGPLFGYESTLCVVEKTRIRSDDGLSVDAYVDLTYGYINSLKTSTVFVGSWWSEKPADDYLIHNFPLKQRVQCYLGPSGDIQIYVTTTKDSVVAGVVLIIAFAVFFGIFIVRCKFMTDP